MCSQKICKILSERPPFSECGNKCLATSNRCFTSSNKKLLGAPGPTTRNKKLLVAKGIATRSMLLDGVSCFAPIRSRRIRSSRRPVKRWSSVSVRDPRVGGRWRNRPSWGQSLKGPLKKPDTVSRRLLSSKESLGLETRIHCVCRNNFEGGQVLFGVCYRGLV